MPFGVILMRSQVLYRAAQAHKHIAKYHNVAQLRYVQHVQIVCSADSVEHICSAGQRTHIPCNAPPSIATVALA